MIYYKAINHELKMLDIEAERYNLQTFTVGDYSVKLDISKNQIRNFYTRMAENTRRNESLFFEDGNQVSAYSESS